MKSRIKLEPRYQYTFIGGLLSTFFIVDPFYPAWFRIAFIPAVVFTATVVLVDMWVRFFGLKLLDSYPKWEPIISGLAAGAETAILILVIIEFYFHIPISILPLP
ncbi:MAG: hypothetical protein JRN53_07125 [Nitrososphaerota archaeon]|nr:hypothetical protein [Nitrososphaerota archaeon]